MRSVALAICFVTGCISVKLERTFPKSVSVQASIPVGNQAADFTLPRLDGPPMQLSSHRGQVVVLCFFSIYCQSCRDELRVMEQLHQRYRGQGLVVVAVSVNGDAEVFRKHFTKAEGWPDVTFPILLDDDDQAGLGTSYSFEGVPRVYLIDRAQRIRSQPALDPKKLSEKELTERSKGAIEVLTREIERVLAEPAPAP